MTATITTTAVVVSADAVNLETTALIEKCGFKRVQCVLMHADIQCNWYSHALKSDTQLQS
jgi:RimJ/RimL family protein N-acetyltransferase